VLEDLDRCYRAVQARDPRFDGWFFVGVTTTGIYCRPSCPARTPRPDRVRFFPSAAAAQQGGFRACLRCRPDAVPGSPEWNVRADVVGRALRLVADGVVDREGVAGLARRLNYGVRHLHRLLSTEVGAGPLALARAQRAQTARVLIETTTLSMADVAFAAGFASVRQFNDTVRQALGRTPTELRHHARHVRASATAPRDATAGRVTLLRRNALGAVALRLPYRRPMSTRPLFDFLGVRAVPGLEHDDGTVYARTLRLPHGNGSVELSPAPARDSADPGYVAARLLLEDLRDLGAAVAACRRLLDLDADPEAVDAALGEDPFLRPLVARVPGRRVPGTVDGFELAVRAVSGQQVSVAGARSVVGRLVRMAGTPIERADEAAGAPGGDALDRVFPSPEEVLAAPDAAFAMPASRRAAVRALARAVDEGALTIDRGADPAEVADGLLRLPGIGPWTAAYVAMRALGDPDAFLPTDLGVIRGLERVGIGRSRERVLEAAERWRPWRAYATAHLWGVEDATATTPRAHDQSRGRTTKEDAA